MELQYKPVANYYKKKTIACPHNEGCACQVKQCNTCGWHPTVAKSRMERIMKGEKL